MSTPTPTFRMKPWSNSETGASPVTRILGIDPGSRITGYGVIELDRGSSRYIDSGCIRTDLSQPLAGRLKVIFESVRQLILEYRPNEFAIEQVFMHRNADSALKLGQARGASICAAALAGLPVSEYAPRLGKQAVVGRGGAAKEQVQHMVIVLLKLQSRLQPDAADALAIALCHGHTLQTARRLGQAAVTGRRR